MSSRNPLTSYSPPALDACVMVSCQFGGGHEASGDASAGTYPESMTKRGKAIGAMGIACAATVAIAGAWTCGSKGKIRLTSPAENHTLTASSPPPQIHAAENANGAPKATQEAHAEADKIQLQAAVQDLLARAQAGQIPMEPLDPNKPQPDLHSRESVGIIVRKWARLDLSSAAAWCLALPESDMKSEAMGQVALAYLAADPESAVQWAQSLPESASCDSVLETMGWEMAAGDPATALDLASTLPDGEIWSASQPAILLQSFSISTRRTFASSQLFGNVESA